MSFIDKQRQRSLSQFLPQHQPSTDVLTHAKTILNARSAQAQQRKIDSSPDQTNIQVVNNAYFGVKSASTNRVRTENAARGFVEARKS